MYLQTDGVAMGSPLGPTLANIFLGHYEQKVLKEANSPLFYCRYVDDTFAIFNSEADGDEFLIKLNALHPALKFTSEKENNNQLSFLDVLVTREDQRITTAVYRKPSFSGISMKWNSFSPRSMKIKLIATLADRAIKICSPNKLDGELKRLQQLFEDSGFPRGVVKATISRKMESLNRAAEIGPKKLAVIVKLPYIGNPSRTYGQKIANAVSSCYGSVKLTPIFTTRRLPLRSSKDMLPTPAKSDIIYHYECHCKSGYVGKTQQILAKRISQHVPPIFRSKSGRKYKMPKKHTSAIGQHLIDNPSCAEKYADDRFSILAHGRNVYHLSVLEAVFILSLRPVLCRQKKFVLPLNIFKSL